MGNGCGKGCGARIRWAMAVVRDVGLGLGEQWL